MTPAAGLPTNDRQGRRRTLRTAARSSVAFRVLPALAAAAALVTALAPGVARAEPVQEDEPVTGAFSCYPRIEGDSYARPAAILRIGARRTYQGFGGAGTFTVDRTKRIGQVTWTSGPLAGGDEATVFFTDWGQSLRVTVPAPDPDAVGTDLDCYRQGARQREALRTFGLKDPQPGTYACVVRDSGARAPALEILAGRRYRWAGASGRYAVDLLRSQDDDSAEVSFTGGPFDGEPGLSSGDGETGVRSLRILTRETIACGRRAAPAPPQRFGPGRAPPVQGRGGLSGLYASYTIDVLGICGGLCWEFRVFEPDGRVYTREPERGLGDAACTRNLPNGLPVCEPYRVRGTTIRIGDEPPQRLARTRRGLRIGDTEYRRAAAVTGLRLRGTYRSEGFFSGGAPPGQGGVVFDRKIVFNANGTFTREGFVGASFTSPPGVDPSVLITLANSSTNRGRFRIIAPNTLELRFRGGTSSRSFVFLPDGPVPRGRQPAALRIEGSDYLLRKS